MMKKYGLIIILLGSILIVDSVLLVDENRLGNTFIVGGSEATPHEFPWLVSIRASLGDLHLCGGVILDSRTILTTGTCTELLTVFYSTVAAGKHNLSATEESQQVVQVASIHAHPQFAQGSDYSNDIAIIKVNPGFLWTQYVSPMEKLQESFDVNDDDLATISGWGAKREEATKTEEILHKASVRVIENNQDCQLLVGSAVTVEDSMICITAPNPHDPTDSCSADQGGPLLRTDDGDDDPTLVGLISFGIGCGRANMPSFCTRVSPYLDFIKQYLES